MSVGLIISLVILAIVLATIFAGVKTVPQGQQWTVERLGKYVRTLTPGLSVIIPYIDRIGRKLSLMETVLDIPSQEVITRDNATVTADGVVFFQVLEPVKAAYEVENLVFALSSLAMTNVRSVIGAMDLDEVLSQRDQINRRLLSVVDQATLAWGIKATRIELRNIQPPQHLLDAMAKQMTAEREKRAEILTAEGAKQSAILRAEGEKQAAVLDAEGRLEAAKRDAEARERLAEAEAKATAVVSAAIGEGNVAALNYFVAQKYVEAFGTLAASPNQKLVLMPMEATGVISSLAGIAELAKDAQAAAKKTGPWGNKAE
ncbi:SPFH domain-containing protein [Ferrovibrio sp.]|uniref:SPFH domain-containing protein n=1 Tax=Ferrovibrio sp. TaxID=1917215 RepID=UPI0025BFEF88|nr:SPFH domain-containing protein [Ferrovibrio sp.]MBX3453871.1 SPFH/Band 7/PHB domain protein [Ferrovibrio sp.]